MPRASALPPIRDPVPLVGGRMVLARPDGHREPTYRVELIRRERVGAAAYVRLDVLPLLPNGKTDRAARGDVFEAPVLRAQFDPDEFAALLHPPANLA